MRIEMGMGLFARKTWVFCIRKKRRFLVCNKIILMILE